MILYLHGLNSSGASHKGRVIREQLAPIRVLSPTYPAHLHKQAVDRLVEELRVRVSEAESQAQPLLLVGSSMGGFYGQFLARQFSLDHLVMINPALRPWEVLRQVVGWQNNLALRESYYLSEEMVAATRRYDIQEVDDGVQTTLLLDKGDELIDWHIAESMYAGIGDLHCFEGGSHAFEHIQEAAMIIARIHRDLEAEKR